MKLEPGDEIQFELPDLHSDGAPVRGSINFTELGNILICFDGYGDFSSEDGFGNPIQIENSCGMPQVIIWADINQEDPTHTVPLDGARESERVCPECSDQREPFCKHGRQLHHGGSNE